MKTVFNDSELAHHWASQYREDNFYGKNSGRTFRAEGFLMYSYSTLIAAIHYVGDIVLLTSTRYSVTTAKQVSYLYDAVSHYKRIIYVPNIFSIEDNNRELVSDQGVHHFHKKNIDFLVDKVKESVVKQEKARNGNYIPSIHYAMQQLLWYVEAFRLEEITDKYLSSWRWAFEKKDQVELYQFLSVSNSLNYDILTEAMNDVMKKVAEKRKSQIKESIKEWKKDLSKPAPLSLRQDDVTYLRINKTKNDHQIETSKNISITNEKAKILWRLICYALNKNTTILFDGEDKLKVDGYYIDKITNKGVLIAGCHTIPLEESEYVAKKLKF